MDQFNPTDWLNEQFAGEAADVDTAVSQQATLLKDYRRRQLEHLHQEYQIERKYIENTPLAQEDRDNKVRQLNQKYELRAVKLDQELEPHVLSLQQKHGTAQAKVTARKDEAMKRVQVVQELDEQGLVTNRAAALQAQLKTLGVSMPLSGLQPPSRKRTIQDATYELKMVSSQLAHYLPADPKWTWRGKTKPADPRGEFIPPDALFAPYVDESNPAQTRKGARPMTQDEYRYGVALKTRAGLLQQELMKLLAENNVGPMQRGMATAAGIQGNPFAAQLREQMPAPAKTQLTPEQAAAFVELSGGDNNKARELARAQGYSF